MDELWSYVDTKGNEIWVWIALERQTRKVVGLASLDRSAETCRELWQSLPADYRKRALIYTDEWSAYPCVLPSKRHRPVPKEAGETNHIERLDIIKIRMRSLRPFADVTADCTNHNKSPSLDRVYTGTSDG